MKNNILRYIVYLGIIPMMFSCEKDENRAIALDKPKPPTLNQPDTAIVLSRKEPDKEFIFEGQPAHFGFNARIEYSLMVSLDSVSDKAIGLKTNFENKFEFIATNLNSSLLKLIKEDTTTKVSMYVKANVEGNIPDAFSDIYPVTFTTYGLPRLDIRITGKENKQKIVSPAGDGKYAGFVKFDAGDSFTFYDPDAGKEYGGDGQNISEGGPPISVTKTAWHLLKADIKALEMKNLKNTVGIVGTINNWDAPDFYMDYNADEGYWYYDQELVMGKADEVKFRLNEDWGVNLGLNKEKPKDLDDLKPGGENIPASLIGGAGTYNVKLWIEYKKDGGWASGKCKFEKIEK